MPRPIEALIHADALRANLERAREAARAAGARVFAVVKADAYGHGIERVWRALAGADGFALLDLAEAERLRAAGWRGPVLLIEGAFEPRDLEACSRLDLWHVVHRDAQIDWLAAHKTQRPHRVFVKLDSGMGRLGFAPAAFRRAWSRLDALAQVGEVTAMTHFAAADGAPGIGAALAVWREATRDLPGERSLANSAATLRHPATHADWVRAGIMLYGSSPDAPGHTAAHWGLAPTMTLRTRLLAVRDVPAGASVGYGAAWTAARATRVGTAACGYADGYPRHAPSGTPVLVDGARCALVGRVSMDMVGIDLTAAPQAMPGSEVVLWGRASADAGGAVLPIDDVAAAAGTVGYELMCAVAPRVMRRLVGDGDDGGAGGDACDRAAPDADAALRREAENP